MAKFYFLQKSRNRKDANGNTVGGKSVILANSTPFVERTVKIGEGAKAQEIKVQSRRRDIKVGVFNPVEGEEVVNQIIAKCKPGDVIEIDAEFTDIPVTNVETGEPTNVMWIV